LGIPSLKLWASQDLQDLPAVLQRSSDRADYNDILAGALESRLDFAKKQGEAKAVFLKVI